ncbi:MAG: DUF4160 domain-containing protein [Sphaerospermopsis sp. SIO1G2]|nr:DUF4160 domain-containing protein [Sphaerospermopsis sp. SIO1G2]
MPTISVFYGIRITMNYNDHPPPHFHAEYQDFEVIVTIDSGEVTGRMPRRAMKLIWEWLDQNKAELQENWERARNRKALIPIDPLE